MIGNRKGFTLLEVTIALGIMAMSIAVLIDYQAVSLYMSNDANTMRLATMLAEEKITEAQLHLEEEGWTTRDIEENGKFDDFGAEDFRSDDLQIDMKERLEEFKWAYTIRKVEMQIPTDLPGMTDSLGDGGYFGESNNEDLQNNTFDLSDIGVTPDMISDTLSDYIREVRVRVWWGDNEDEMSQVELLTHVINPSGVVTDTEEAEE